MQCVGAILGGSIFGNVISPIADDTILSSMSCGCDLDAHCRTTLPYAGVAAFFSLLLGSLPMGLGIYGSGVAIGACFLAMLAVLLVLGKRTNGRHQTRVAASLRLCSRQLKAE